MKSGAVLWAGAATVVAFASMLAPFADGRAHRARERNPARAIVLESLGATGGLEKARSWTTRIDEGHMVVNWPGWGELHANYTRWIKKPDKMKIDQDFSAFDHPFFFTYYYNGGEVWAVVNLGVRQNERYTRRMTKNMRTADELAYYAAECDTFWLVADVADDSLVLASSIDRVGIADRGDTVYFDFDKGTRLPVRRIEDRGAVHVLFDDYRETTAGKIAHHLKIYQQGALSEEYVLDEIVFGEKIDDSIFEEMRPAHKAGKRQ